MNLRPKAALSPGPDELRQARLQGIARRCVKTAYAVGAGPI